MSRKSANRRIRSAAVIILVLAAVLLYGTVAVNPAPSHGEVDGSLAGKTLLLTGDSRSSTDYTFYKELMEEKSGCIAILAGASGRTAAYNASDEYMEIVTGTDHDFSIWLVGGNDTGEAGTVGTFDPESELAEEGEPVVEPTDAEEEYDGTTFIQAIDHIMRRYRFFWGEISGEDGEGAPVMIFCTDLPQQRESADSEWSKQENWERKRQAIIECCEKNDVICLDLYELCGFDMEEEPMFVPPTDKESDLGIYYMDGLHPNRDGMDVITTLEIEEIKKYLAAIQE